MPIGVEFVDCLVSCSFGSLATCGVTGNGDNGVAVGLGVIESCVIKSSPIDSPIFLFPFGVVVGEFTGEIRGSSEEDLLPSSEVGLRGKVYPVPFFKGDHEPDQIVGVSIDEIFGVNCSG